MISYIYIDFYIRRLQVIDHVTVFLVNKSFSRGGVYYKGAFINVFGF